MAAEQACGHREIAAEGYTKILKDEQLDPQIYDFVNDQRKISTLFAGDFLTLYTIVSEEEMSYFKPQNIPILTINAQQLASYVKYDKTKDPAVLCDLTDWQTLERGDNVSSNFSVHKLVSDERAFKVSKALKILSEFSDFAHRKYFVEFHAWDGELQRRAAAVVVSCSAHFAPGMHSNRLAGVS